MTTGTPDATATTFYAGYLEEQRRKYRINLHLRVLQDLLADPPPGGGGEVDVRELDG